VLTDEEENNTTLDGITRSLNYMLPNERTWDTLRTSSRKQPICRYHQGMIRQVLQYTMKTVVQIPGMRLPYTCYPPIVSNIDRWLTDGIETTPPRLTPIKEGKVINDIVYAV
jgi:hypothetical protein